MIDRPLKTLDTALRWFDRAADRGCGPYPDFEVSERVRVAVDDVLQDFNGKRIRPVSVLWGAARALSQYIKDSRL